MNASKGCTVFIFHRENYVSESLEKALGYTQSDYLPFYSPDEIITHLKKTTVSLFLINGDSPEDLKIILDEIFGKKQNKTLLIIFSFLNQESLIKRLKGYDETFTSMVTEARKYKISLILANQYLEQLGKAMRSALFGNIGPLIAFKAGVEDSKYLQEHFANKISADNFRTIPLYHAYASLLMDGELLPPFTIKTIPIESLPADSKKRDKIIKQSRERYGNKQEGR